MKSLTTFPIIKLNRLPLIIVREDGTHS